MAKNPNKKRYKALLDSREKNEELEEEKVQTMREISALNEEKLLCHEIFNKLEHSSACLEDFCNHQEKQYTNQGMLDGKRHQYSLSTNNHSSKNGHHFKRVTSNGKEGLHGQHSYYTSQITNGGDDEYIIKSQEELKYPLSRERNPALCQRAKPYSLKQERKVRSEQLSRHVGSSGEIRENFFPDDINESPTAELTELNKEHLFWQQDEESESAVIQSYGFESAILGPKRFGTPNVSGNSIPHRQHAGHDITAVSHATQDSRPTVDSHLPAEQVSKGLIQAFTVGEPCPQVFPQQFTQEEKVNKIKSWLKQEPKGFPEDSPDSTESSQNGRSLDLECEINLEANFDDIYGDNVSQNNLNFECEVEDESDSLPDHSRYDETGQSLQASTHEREGDGNIPLHSEEASCDISSVIDSLNALGLDCEGGNSPPAACGNEAKHLPKASTQHSVKEADKTVLKKGPNAESSKPEHRTLGSNSSKDPENTSLKDISNAPKTGNDQDIQHLKSMLGSCNITKNNVSKNKNNSNDDKNMYNSSSKKESHSLPAQKVGAFECETKMNDPLRETPTSLPEGPWDKCMSTPEKRPMSAHSRTQGTEAPKKSADCTFVSCDTIYDIKNIHKDNNKSYCCFPKKDSLELSNLTKAEL